MERLQRSGRRVRSNKVAKLKGLKRYTSGNVRYVYHRASGIRLPSDVPEDHPLFLEAYLAAEKGTPPDAPRTVAAGSVEAVVRDYLASQGFLSLSKGYQDVRRRDLRRLCKQADGRVAALRFASIRSQHIKKDLGALPPNPANERLKSWRALVEYALYNEIISANPTADIRKAAAPKSEGHTPWLFEDIEKFRRRWSYGTIQRAAFELNFWLGSRISDCVGLGDDNVTHDGWITFTQKKTGSEVSVPFRRALPSFATSEDLEHLYKALEALDASRSTFLETALGDTRSAKGASQWFSEAAQVAGISAGKTSHGLRKSRMILLAERGATLHQIAAWSGHETLKEIERYTKKANNKKILTPSVLETGEFLR